MRRRDLLKLAAAAPLGLLGRARPRPADALPPLAAGELQPLTLKLRPIIAQIPITPELLEDWSIELAAYFEARLAREFHAAHDPQNR